MTTGYEVSAERVESLERLLIRLRRIVDPTLESYFYSMIMKARKRKKLFVRKPYSRGRKVFKLKTIITPDRVRIRIGDIITQASIATNPTITGSSRKAVLFVRTATLPGGFTETFIATTTLDINEGFYELVLKPYVKRLLPSESIEDPRIDPVEPNTMYHTRSYYYWNKNFVFTFKTFLDKREGLKIKPVLFLRRGEPRAYTDLRDTFPLNPKYMLFRPYVEKKNIGAILTGPRRDTFIELREARVIPELIPLRWEVKTGGNFVVRLSRSENLFFYYSTDPYGVHRVYVAVLSDNGELLGGSSEPVLSPDTKTYMGRLPSTIFPCGAIVEKNRIIMATGLGGEALALYESYIDDILQKIFYKK